MSSTISDTYQTKLSITTPVLPVGQLFLVHYCAEGFNSNTSGECRIRLQQDAATINECSMESDDTDDVLVANAIKQITGAGSAVTFNIQFNNTGSGTSSIRRARLVFYRVA